MRVMVTDLSAVHVEPVQVEVSAPGKKTFCSERGLAVKVSNPKATPCVKCWVLVQSCSVSNWARGCKLPPLQFFSVAMSATAPFLKHVSAPPGATSKRKRSPTAPEEEALVKLVVPPLKMRCRKMVVLFSTQS